MSNPALISYMNGMRRGLANGICKAAFIYLVRSARPRLGFTRTAVIMQSVLYTERNVPINRLNGVQQLTAFQNISSFSPDSAEYVTYCDKDTRCRVFSGCPAVIAYIQYDMLIVKVGIWLTKNRRK